jgi:hypothetical protein
VLRNSTYRVFDASMYVNSRPLDPGAGPARSAAEPHSATKFATQSLKFLPSASDSLAVPEALRLNHEAFQIFKARSVRLVCPSVESKTSIAGAVLCADQRQHMKLAPGVLDERTQVGEPFRMPQP